jgi:hypothetical protein
MEEKFYLLFLGQMVGIKEEIQVNGAMRQTMLNTKQVS